MKKIAVYCVNYNSYDELRSFFNSVEIAASEAKDVAIVTLFIADNTEANVQSISSLKSMYMEVKIYEFHENLGYFGAVQRMMKDSEPTGYDFAIISNVDLSVGNNLFLTLANKHYEQGTGWIAPTIFSKIEPRDRNPKICKRYSLRKLKLLLTMYRFPVLHVLYTRTMYKRKILQKHDAGKIYAGHGSFIILCKYFIEKCGVPSYPIFLFGEELYLAEECRENKLAVLYDPSIIVYDSEHVSTGKMKGLKYYKYNKAALQYIIKQFYPSSNS